MFYLCSLLGVLWCPVLTLSLSILSLFLYMVLGSVLTSLIYMWLSSFANTTCWRGCLFFSTFSLPLAVVSPYDHSHLSGCVVGSQYSFKKQMFWGLVFPVQDPQAGEHNVGLSPFSLGRTSAIVINLPFVGHLPRGLGLDYNVPSPLLPSSFWFLLYLLSCGKSFLLVFRSFS